MTFIAQAIPSKLLDIEAYMKRINGFGSGDYQNCPCCEQPLNNIHAIECTMSFVLYSRPCGCRLGHWDKAPQWLYDNNKVYETSVFDDEQEPTAQELREDGYDIPLSIDEWNSFREYQESNGQQRLPLEFLEFED
jgi:hypothetical protein